MSIVFIENQVYLELFMIMDISYLTLETVEAKIMESEIFEYFELEALTENRISDCSSLMKHFPSNES